MRPLLHGADVVRAEHPDAGCLLHGVVSPDRREALFCYARLQTSSPALPGRLRLPGLDPSLTYSVRRRDEAGAGRGTVHAGTPWWRAGSTLASGAVLQSVGLAAPALNPAQAVVVQLVAQ
jgi:alpha-galactosidase